LDDSEELANQTARWRALDVETGLPKTLTIEVYLDLQELAKGKSCVISDEQGKRWDVSESITTSRSKGSKSVSDMNEQPLVLERWQFSMEESAASDSDGDTDILSTIYKKTIPVFRSMHSQLRLLPLWKYYRYVTKQSSSNPANQPLKIKYRVISGPLSSSQKTALEIPLYPNQRDVVDRFEFGSLPCPAGILHATVAYRTNCSFRVDDSEALLSSQFMRSGDEYFRPSWPGRAHDNQVVGSAPTTKKRMSTDGQEQTQVYGSMSTFHTNGPRTSTSPISALRALTSGGSPLSPSGRVSSSQQRAQDSLASIRSNDGMPINQRRQSISFQPFRAGSLASSPATTGMQGPLSPVGQPSRTGASYSHRSRPSMTTLPQAILRTPNLHHDNPVASSTSSSPRPAPITKFSSSFNYRKSRMSSGASRNDDERSSGKPSPSSSARVGSDVLNETRADQTSSGSVQQNDDDNLKDFLQLLDSKKELKSLSRNDSAARDASTIRTNAALSKYHRMKDDNIALSDSISSSVHLNRSSGSSSRQLPNPNMLQGTSISPGSSLGKALSPHTPHTPAVPSRLGANSTVSYSAPQPRRSQARTESIGQEDRSRATSRETGAINIPVSPRPWTYGRRSSSVRQQPSVDDDAEYAPRPYSLPADERDMSITDLSINEPSGTTDQASSDEKIDDIRSEEPSPGDFVSTAPRTRYSSTADPSSHGFLSRPRGSISRRGAPSFGHSYTPSSASQSGIGAATASTYERGGARGSPSLRNSTQEEEALIFELSDMDSRRSLEEANERGGFRGGRWGR
jgi:autophagy-related protein 13